MLVKELKKSKTRNIKGRIKRIKKEKDKRNIKGIKRSLDMDRKKKEDLEELLEDLRRCLEEAYHTEIDLYDSVYNDIKRTQGRNVMDSLKIVRNTTENQSIYNDCWSLIKRLQRFQKSISTDETMKQAFVEL